MTTYRGQAELLLDDGDVVPVEAFLSLVPGTPPGWRGSISTRGADADLTHERVGSTLRIRIPSGGEGRVALQRVDRFRGTATVVGSGPPPF